MANQVAARLQGDDYQFLFAWHQALGLLMPTKSVAQVIVEDDSAGSLDDVTVLHSPDSNLPDAYHQVKFHVDQRSAYSVKCFTALPKNGRSLLQKWFSSWTRLREQTPNRPLEVHLLSNWGWVQGDLGTFVGGSNAGLKGEFFVGSPRSKAGRLRQAMLEHLQVPGEEFLEFARALRFHLSFGSEHEVEERAAERMEHLMLKNETSALTLAVGVVRNWVKTGQKQVTREVLEDSIRQNALRLSEPPHSATHVYLTTIKEQAFDIEPDYILDWRKYFEGSVEGGHQLLNPADWNAALLPQLQALEQELNSATSSRFIKVRGQARLSAWFAFGFIFREVNRYTLELAQGTSLWKSDAAPRSLRLTSNAPEGELLGPDSTTVAVGISVTGALDEDVRAHLLQAGEAKALLLLQPENGTGPSALTSAGDATALAEHVKLLTRQFVKRHRATRLYVYYFGPLAGACFLGHRFNAVCREIVFMEHTHPDYVPTFCLL